MDSEVVAAKLYTRKVNGWDDVDADSLKIRIELPKLGCVLKLADIYEGTEFTDTAS